MDKISFLMAGLCSLNCVSIANAGVMGPLEVEQKQYSYVSAFGGGGSLSSISMTQLGTAYPTEANGGPLAVNSFGHSNSQSQWLVGGNLGHRWKNQALSFLGEWSIAPAAELEGFYLDANTIAGQDVNNDTYRLDEHLFNVTYPTTVGVGLVNGLIYFEHAEFLRWHPYVGGGIGASLISIKNANSTQVDPFEQGINHYNSDASDSVTAFATQAKVGLGFDWTEHVGLFVEYRYLYLGSADFIFGSTVYPTHVPTNNWTVKLGSQSYNSAVGGIRLTI